MEDKQLIKYDGSFLFRFKNFFKNLFSGKKKCDVANEDTSSNKITEGMSRISFFDEIKFDGQITNNDIKMRKFLAEIDGNRAALNSLSIDRLKKLEKYYDKIIEENQRKLENLKNS